MLQNHSEYTNRQDYLDFEVPGLSQLAGSSHTSPPLLNPEEHPIPSEDKLRNFSDHKHVLDPLTFCNTLRPQTSFSALPHPSEDRTHNCNDRLNDLDPTTFCSIALLEPHPSQRQDHFGGIPQN
jgi:hypothetical protein